MCITCRIGDWYCASSRVKYPNLKFGIPEPGNYLTYPANREVRKIMIDSKGALFFLEWDIYVIVIVRKPKGGYLQSPRNFWEDQFVFSPRQGWNPWNVVSQVSFQDLSNILCLAVLWIILVVLVFPNTQIQQMSNSEFIFGLAKKTSVFL